MKYNNAEKVFPGELIEEIRKYIPEGFIYIPSVDKRKGSLTGQKKELRNRNKKIYMDYQSGKSVDEISKEQYLSTSSIYRILNNQKNAK